MAIILAIWKGGVDCMVVEFIPSSHFPDIVVNPVSKCGEICSILYVYKITWVSNLRQVYSLASRNNEIYNCKCFQVDYHNKPTYNCQNL